MSKSLTAILVGLVLLTLGGLIVVSNLISNRNDQNENAAVAPLQAKIKSTKTPLVRPSFNPKQIGADLNQAVAELKQIAAAIDADDWGQAQTIHAGFILKGRRLPSAQLNQPLISPLWQDFFDLYSVQLERSIAEKQTRSARIAIHELSGIIGESQARLAPKSMPVELYRLNYLASELILWKQLDDDKMVDARKAALSEAWDDANSLIRTKKDGEKLAEQIGLLIDQFVQAQSMPELQTTYQTFTTTITSAANLFGSSDEP